MYQGHDDETLFIVKIRAVHHGVILAVIETFRVPPPECFDTLQQYH